MTDYRVFCVADKQVLSSGRLITSNNQFLIQSDMINGVSNQTDSKMSKEYNKSTNMLINFPAAINY